MLRTFTLSLLMLISLLVMLPFASSTAHGLRSASQQQHRYRRHSRAWWRRHRARIRLRRAAALAHRSSPLGAVLVKSASPNTALTLTRLPAGWNNATLANSGELKFRTEGSATTPGQGTLAVVARSRPNPAYLT